MGKIISRVDPPLVLCAMVRRFEDPICYQIPHLGVPILKILFHAQAGLVGMILAVLHALELR